MRTEICLEVEKKLFKRLRKLGNKYDFINRVGLYRVIWGKKVDHIKIVSVDRMPAEWTKSYEFNIRLKKRLTEIEDQFHWVNLALRGK